jgi:GTP-binding protein HflX
VVDATAPAAQEQADTVDQVLEQLGAADKPRVVALNKIDLLGPPGARRVSKTFAERYPRLVTISALREVGHDRLGEALDEASEGQLVALELLVPYGEESVLQELRQLGGVDRVEYTERGTYARGRAPRQAAHRFQPYVLD